MIGVPEDDVNADYVENIVSRVSIRVFVLSQRMSPFLKKLTAGNGMNERDYGIAAPSDEDETCSVWEEECGSGHFRQELLSQLHVCGFKEEVIHVGICFRAFLSAPLVPDRESDVTRDANCTASLNGRRWLIAPGQRFHLHDWMVGPVHEAFRHTRVSPESDDRFRDGIVPFSSSNEDIAVGNVGDGRSIRLDDVGVSGTREEEPFHSEGKEVSASAKGSWTPCAPHFVVLSPHPASSSLISKHLFLPD